MMANTQSSMREAWLHPFGRRTPEGKDLRIIELEEELSDANDKIRDLEAEGKPLNLLISKDGISFCHGVTRSFFTSWEDLERVAKDTFGMKIKLIHR